jgi:hypothetical protein
VIIPRHQHHLTVLLRVFLEWIERLRRCIDTNGEYVGGPN